MSGWQDWIFGNLPPSPGEPIGPKGVGSFPSGPPARPTSRGATFGANYQALPTSSHIDDRRQEPPNYPYWLRRASPWATSDDYSPSPLGGAIPGPLPPVGFNPGASNQMFAHRASGLPYMGPMWPGDPRLDPAAFAKWTTQPARRP
jgi:hypothetical protein